MTIGERLMGTPGLRELFAKIDRWRHRDLYVHPDSEVARLIKEAEEEGVFVPLDGAWLAKATFSELGEFYEGEVQLCWEQQPEITGYLFHDHEAYYFASVNPRLVGAGKTIEDARADFIDEVQFFWRKRT